MKKNFFPLQKITENNLAQVKLSTQGGIASNSRFPRVIHYFARLKVVSEEYGGIYVELR